MQKVSPFWYVSWTIIYIVIFVLNIILPSAPPTRILSCVGIAFNLFFVAKYSREDRPLMFAFTFTLISDIILAIDNSSFLGVYMFTFAQFFHFSRLVGLKPNYFMYFLVAVTLIAGISPLLKTDAMFVISTFYACLLGANIITSLNIYKQTKTKTSRLCMLGFVFFAFCDLSVACSYLSRIGLLPAHLTNFANTSSWIFYYPSQVFLANSSKSLEKLKKV